MSHVDDNDPVLDLLLAGAPARVLDAVLPPEARADLDATGEALAMLALSLPPVAPSSSLRAKLEDRLARRAPAPERRALVVLDMIEDYLTPGRPLFVPRARLIVPALQRRLDDARREGTPVIFLCDSHEPHDPELEVWPRHAVAGTSGPNVIPELAPRANEPVLPHRTYSAFFGSDFERVLREQQITAIELTGCATEVGMLATATDALMRGFRVTVPEATQAGASALAEQVALGVLSVMRPVEPMPASP